MKRNFDSWESQDLEFTFGIRKVKGLGLLNDWLASTSEFTDFEKQRIEILRERIFDLADYWNEDELKMQGIAKIIDIVDYYSDTHTIFSQRNLSATIDDITLNGRVDFVIAKGYQKPVDPYFFIHEYKQERKGGETDPKGQLLAELFAAQHLNNYKFPSYGCYVVGRMWFFVILKGKEYVVSNAFNSSDEDIYKIISILRKIKEFIDEWEKL